MILDGKGLGLRARVLRRDVAVRVVDPEIEADGCPSRVRRPYKTTGFAPKVPYFAPLPLRLKPPPPIALASYARTAIVDRLVSVLQSPSSLRLSCSRHRACSHLLPNRFNGVVGQI